MRVPGRTTARRSFRWTRSRITARAIVLGYHQVSDCGTDDYSLTISPDHFAEHMEVIRELAIPMRLGELVSGLRAGTIPKRRVVVTMDDGYVDNLRNAKPILEAYDVPATVFVVASSYGREFWWDELSRMLAKGSAIPADLELCQGRGWSFSDQCTEVDHDDTDLLYRLHGQLSSCSTEERRRRLDELRTIIRLSEDGAADVPRCMTESEVSRLAASRCIEIGAHSHTHATMADLPEEEQWQEIRNSKKALEDTLGRPVTAFSFPHGSHSALTRRLVAEAGFDSACCSGADVVVPRTDPYAIPRFWPPNCSGRVFGRWLAHWL